MIVSLFSGNEKKRWFFMHLIIGFFCTIFPQTIIIWFYLFFISSFNKILSDYILRDSTRYLIPLVIYLSSFEVLDLNKVPSTGTLPSKGTLELLSDKVFVKIPPTTVISPSARNKFVSTSFFVTIFVVLLTIFFYALHLHFLQC